MRAHGNIMIKRYDMQYDLNNCLIHYKLGRGETLKWGNATDIAYDANQHIISEKTYEQGKYSGFGRYETCQ